MAHFPTGDDECRDLIRDDIARSDPADGYRFGRTSAKHLRRRTALSRVNGYLKNMIEAIANSKMRRMERELQLHDRSSNEWMAGHPDRAGVREN